MSFEERLKVRKSEWGAVEGSFPETEDEKDFVPFIRLTKLGLVRATLSPDDIELIVDLTVERLKKYLNK